MPSPHAFAYKRYGGRGIKVCKEWLNDFITFKDWALANGYEEHLTIDRIDNDGNYEALNCQWLILSANSKKRQGGRDSRREACQGL